MHKHDPFQTLSGIRVLDLSRLYPGPFCSMHLSDFGADVIRIEGRRYESEGLGFDTIMRNKRHMTLNFKHPKGLEIFYKLAGKSDVIIEGFRPGVAQKLKIDYPTLKKLKEDLIYCSISGFGQDGPYRSLAGHDVNYIGLAGILSRSGQSRQKPSFPSVPVGDGTGGLYCAIGILLALFRRERTGEGQLIDISMLESIISLMPFFIHFMSTEGNAPTNENSHVLGAFAYYNIYETKDKKYITLGALEPRFWENICRVLKREDLIPYQFDISKREEIIESLSEIFRQKTRDEWWKN